MRLKSIAGALIAAGILAPGLAAQSADSVRLTLARALDIAEGNNPTYRQASNNALLNGIEMRTTWFDQLLPRMDLTLLSTAFTGNLQRVAFDNFGNPIANPAADWNYFSRTTQQLRLTWNVRGASLFQGHRRQSLTNQERDLGVVRALTGLQVQIQRLYMDALEQRDLMRAEEELVAARQIDLTVAERLFSLAMRTRVDVLNAELAVEQQALFLRQQRAAGIKFIASTDAGIPGVAHHDLVAGLEAFGKFAGLSPADLLRSATSEAAIALGLEAETGRIAAGYSADLLLLRSDPLEDPSALHDLEVVVARGAWFDRETRTRLAAQEPGDD